MDVESVTIFFKWCSIINGTLLFCWLAMVTLLPGLVYKTQKFWFPMSEPTFQVVMYGFLGFYKIVFLFFNLVPFVVLRCFF